MAEPIRILAPELARDRVAIFDLTGKTFSHAGYWKWQERCRNGYFDHSHYDWQTSRIGLVGDVLATHFGVWDYQMRIGLATVRVGGIGAVATHNDYRKRGYMVQTGRESLDAQRTAGYDLTMLFGIRDFYHRFGYVRAWADSSWVLRTEHLPEGLPSVTLEQYTGGWDDEFADLYNAQNAGATGTAVRPTYLANYHPDWQAFQWRGATGAVAGYVMVASTGDTMTVHEHVGPSDEILAAVAALAEKRWCRTVRFRGLPYESDLCRRLRRGTALREQQFVGNGGAMIHTLNLRATLEKLADELGRRLARSPYAHWSGMLTVHDAHEDVGLEIDGKTVRVKDATNTPHAVRGGEEIAQLLIGTDEPGETVANAGIRLTGDAAALAPVLFPAQHPTLGSWDHY
jgi:hypothetical protein